MNIIIASSEDPSRPLQKKQYEYNHETMITPTLGPRAYTPPSTLLHDAASIVGPTPNIPLYSVPLLDLFHLGCRTLYQSETFRQDHIHPLYNTNHVYPLGSPSLVTQLLANVTNTKTMFRNFYCHACLPFLGSTRPSSLFQD